MEPKSLLRFCTVVPHELSALRKQRLELELLTRLSTHENLRCPANQLGFAPHGVKIRDTREPSLARIDCAWRECCAAKRRPADLPGAEDYADAVHQTTRRAGRDNGA